MMDMSVVWVSHILHIALNYDDKVLTVILEKECYEFDRYQLLNVGKLLILSSATNNYTWIFTS